MLDKARVIAALEAKRDQFASYDQRAGEQARRYVEALTCLAALDGDQVRRRLAGIETPGALPSAERIAGRPVVQPFANRWANHEEARRWALEVIRGTTTLAVDGSQITATKDFSVPVGAVQIGWFENQHNATGGYTKDVTLEVLAPKELDDPSADGQSFPDLQVNLRRFQIECSVLVEGMRRLQERKPTPVCFFDGSLVISFAAHMQPPLRNQYLGAVHGLLRASEETRVPLVGYIDTSHAHDLVTMLRWLDRQTEPPEISDAALLRPRMAWGDRTEAFIAQRDDGLFRGAPQNLDYQGQVAFLYLKTTANNAPARLDLPLWVIESGQLERVVDIVRAECVVGTGYPYAVETADAVAVITMEDRQRFYGTFQEFVGKLGLELRYARKAYSKRGRR
ncbi:MAG: DNA double-strand break repair nuclease NurA [Anaerolineae bacterium]